MSFNYSVMLNIENKPVLVVGGGTVAKRKIKDLLALKAQVTVIAPSILDEIFDIIASVENCHCKQRTFHLSDIADLRPFIVFAATDNLLLNREITNYCNANQILVNSITEPSEGSLSVQAAIRKPQYAVSVSTYGQGPGFSKTLKEYLESVLDDKFDLAVKLYVDIRQWLFTVYDDSEIRIHYLRKLTINNIYSLMNEEALEYNQLLEKVKEWLSCS